MFLLQFQNDLLPIGFFRLSSQYKANRELPFPRIVRGKVESQFMTVGDQITRFGVDAGPQDSWLNFVGYRTVWYNNTASWPEVIVELAPAGCRLRHC